MEWASTLCTLMPDIHNDIVQRDRWRPIVYGDITAVGRVRLEEHLGIMHVYARVERSLSVQVSRCGVKKNYLYSLGTSEGRRILVSINCNKLQWGT